MSQYTFSHSPLLTKIRNNAIFIPEKTAIYTISGTPITYKELWHNIISRARYLKDSGIKCGDMIMLSADKDVEFIYFYLASHLIGVVNVVVDSSNSEEHLHYIASLVRPEIIIGFAIPDYKHLFYRNIKFETNNDNKLDLFEPLTITENDTADIMFTSGTSGKPKGVRLSHINIFSSAQNINGFIKNNDKDIELIGLPICHSFGLGRVRCNLIAGSTIVLNNGFANLKSVFDKFEKYSVSGFAMVPAIFSYIKKLSGKRMGRFADQIRYIEIGSASMTLEDKQLLSEMFPNTRICMHYGMTEASRAVFMEFHENKSDLMVTGKPVNQEVSVKILDEVGDELTIGSEGEICIAGNMVSKSYYLPEDNNGSYVNNYLRTGDLGFFTEDGNLHLLARKKEMINVGGKKVNPIEIEEVIEKLTDCECMCVSSPDPGGMLGEVPKVLIVQQTFKDCLEELKEKLRGQIESYKMPRIFEFVEHIPKTESGKKKRI